MPRFIGGKFGQQVGISTGHSIKGGGIFDMDDQYVTDVLSFMEPFADSFNAVDQMPDALPEVKYPRGDWHRPDAEENEHGGWYVKTTIKGADSGVLAGKTVAIKDSACVADIPMMNGASVLEGYVPDMDATVVTRVLDAGGTITVSYTHLTLPTKA